MRNNMAEETFSDLGRVEAIAKLYEGTPYKPFEEASFETSGKSVIQTKARTFIEGIDFDLTYFPLKHLGYKCVTAVTGELYASFSHPRTLEIRLGISAKLDFKHIKEAPTLSKLKTTISHNKAFKCIVELVDTKPRKRGGMVCQSISNQ